MHLFEQWVFLLCYRPKIILLECTSHCLGCDRRRNNIINEIGSLNSIIKSSSSDLVQNRLFITRRKLERTATPVISISKSIFFLILSTIDLPIPVFVWIWHTEYPSERRVMIIECLEENVDFMVCWKRRMMIDLDFNMLNMVKPYHMTLFNTLTVNLITIRLVTWCKLIKWM